MNVYSVYTSSHEKLLNDWFLPSIPKTWKLCLTKVDQVCPSGSYHSSGWYNMMASKYDVIIEAIKENKNKYFIHSDIDILFFEPSNNLEQLDLKTDLIIQRNTKDDPANVCPGFFICKGTSKMAKLFKTIRNITLEEQTDDELLLNQYLLRNTKFNWSYLPDVYYTPGIQFGSRASSYKWSDTDDIKLPNDVALYHANYTVGIDNKIRQLTTAKRLHGEK